MVLDQKDMYWGKKYIDLKLITYAKIDKNHALK